MADRRVSPRYKANIPVTIEILEGQTPVQHLDGLATTVSDRGMTLVMGQPPSKKSGIFFKFTLPGNHNLIIAQGSIVWHFVNTDTQKEAFGCCFTGANIFETNGKGTPSPPPSPLKGEGAEKATAPDESGNYKRNKLDKAPSPSPPPSPIGRGDSEEASALKGEGAEKAMAPDESGNYKRNKLDKAPSPSPSPIGRGDSEEASALKGEGAVGKGVYGRGRNRLKNIFLDPAPERRSSDRRKDINIDYQSEKCSSHRRSTGNLLDRITKLGKSLKRWESSWTYFRVVQSASQARVIVDKAEKIMLGSNNYLGLTTHPAVKKAASEALEKYGTGSGGVPVLSGTMDLHVELARRLAEFKGTEDCVLFSSGFVANTALFSTLLESGDAVFIDERSHASIIDGCRMSSADIHFYAHKDIKSLEKKLASDKSHSKLIATDSVFSMDGDIAPLDRIYELAKKYNASIMIDEAHATGVLGKTGRGLAEHFGLVGKIDFTVVTFSKALGCSGGAVCCDKNVARYLKTQSRNFIFSSGLTPVTCAAAIAAIDVIESHPELILRLRENVSYLESGLKNIGYNIVPTQSAVIPIIIGSEVKTYELAQTLHELGLFVNAISRPAVPRKTSRLRVSVMATHTKRDLEFAVVAFAKAGQRLEII